MALLAKPSSSGAPLVMQSPTPLALMPLLHKIAHAPDHASDGASQGFSAASFSS